LETTIRNVLKDIKGESFEYEENLITGGYLSSFDLIAVVVGLEKALSIAIPLAEIMPENFNSVEDIKKLLERIQNSTKRK